VAYVEAGRTTAFHINQVESFVARRLRKVSNSENVDVPEMAAVLLQGTSRASQQFRMKNFSAGGIAGA
jgi:glycyl-tRNA synthetase beta subunit